MANSSCATSLNAARRATQPITAHFSSLAALFEAVREYGTGATIIHCAARYLELPASPTSGMFQGVWGVLVTARIPCAAGRGEATLSAWIVADELPRSVATVSRRDVARAHLADLQDQVWASIQASGFSCQPGCDPVPATAFWCRARFNPGQVSPATTTPKQVIAAPIAPYTISDLHAH